MIEKFPAYWLLVGAVIQPLLPKEGQRWSFLLWPIMALAAVLLTPAGDAVAGSLLGHDLVIVRIDALSRVFGIVFALTGILGGIYALHNRDTSQQCAALLYCGGALGVTFAGDLLTLFVFWELMAAASVWLIYARRTPESSGAAGRYILVHLFGGALLMAGILLRGDLQIEAIPKQGAGLAEWLMLLGIALNAAVVPLHAWLADSYPRATVTGAVFLCAFTTKSAVYVLARMYPGWEILVGCGVLMAIYGTIYGLLSNDVRGVLSYSTISQVGYMVCGVGIGSELAINGVAAHAFCHVLYKGLLFMGMGLVIKTTGIQQLNRLGGFWYRQKLAVLLYMIGALAISGFPFFNGYISKSAIIAAVNEAHFPATSLLLLLASVGTFLHTGLRLPYLVWFGPRRGIRPDPAPRNMYVAMGCAAFLCTLLGVAPGLLYAYLPSRMEWAPYTLHHLGETVQMLTLAFAGFVLLRPLLAAEPKLVVDADWLYRKPLARVAGTLVTLVNATFDVCARSSRRFAIDAQRFLANPVAFWRGVDRKNYDADEDRPTIAVTAFLALVLVGLLAFWVAG